MMQREELSSSFGKKNVHCGRAFLLVLIALIALSVRVGAAQGQPESPVTGAESSGSEYRLAAGDHLSVVVFDQDQLSGNFILDSAGRVQLPLAGPVKVSGLTLPEAQNLIQERFADGILVEPTVSLRIAEYRSIVIFGNVREPGTYPFQFGQSVRAAIGNAGGQGRVSELPSAMSDFVMAEERVRLLEVRRQSLLARKTRLVAQRDEAFQFVPQLVAHERDATLTAVLAAESDLFSRVMDAYRDELELLQQQQPRIEAQTLAVRDQLANERRRLKIISGRVAELGAHKERGLVRTYVLNEQQREEARAAAEVSRLQSELARLEREMGDLAIRIQAVKADFTRQAMAELHATRQELREVEINLQMARELWAVRAEDAGVMRGIESAHTILITRTGPRGAITLKATYDTLIEPGDVIEVRRITFPLSSRWDVAIGLEGEKAAANARGEEQTNE